MKRFDFRTEMRSFLGARFFFFFSATVGLPNLNSTFPESSGPDISKQHPVRCLAFIGDLARYGKSERVKTIAPLGEAKKTLYGT